MTRISCAMLALAGLFPALLSAQEPTQEEAVKYRQMAGILESKVMSVDFKDAKLSDVVKFFSTVTGLNIVIDPAVYQETPETDLTVSIKIDEIPAGDILDLILRFKKLGRAFRHGVLLITTIDKSAGQPVMRLYDVRDLSVPLKDFPGPEIELKAGGETSPAVFSEAEEPAPKHFTADEIVEQIKGATGGTTWDDNPKCRITIFKGMLIITQTAKVHGEIATLLAQLREVR